jgi:microcystin degradation protein MlrC
MAAREFPVSLFDTGDNVGGGSAADATFILSELLKQNALGWVYTLYDPAAVEAAKKGGIGSRFEMAVGGHTDARHGDPVVVRGRVRTLSTGNWIEPEARHGGRRYWSQGHAAVIEAEGSTPDLANLLILTTERVMPFSLRQLSSLGIDAAMQRILVAKGTVAPRAAYEPVSKKIILVDSPGATAINPARFQFTRVRAKLFGME